MKNRFGISFGLALAAAALFALPAFAQDGATLPTDLNKVLQDLSTGGAAILVAVIFSWLAEQWPAFGAQPPMVKFAEQAAASGGLGVGSWYLITYQPELVTQLAPIFAILVMSLAPVILNQVWHAVTKK